MKLPNSAQKISVVLWAIALYAVATAGSRAAVDKPAVFQVTASAGNTSAYVLTLDNPAINAKPKAMLIVTQCATTVANPHPVGVYYSAPLKKWQIINEDLTDIPTNAIFNVRALSGATAETFHLDATVSNSALNHTVIDEKGLNGNPSGLTLVTHFINPIPAVGYVYLTNNLGVFYDMNWVVYNEDESSARVVSYNLANITGAAGASVQTSAAGNITSDAFSINDPTANNNPNAIVFVTHNFNPGGAGGEFHDHVVGVFYSAGVWYIVNEDETSMAAGVSFNVQVFAGPTH